MIEPRNLALRSRSRLGLRGRSNLFYIRDRVFRGVYSSIWVPSELNLIVSPSMFFLIFFLDLDSCISALGIR